jgi:isopropylmalate/homocitrate/citramalate synthase
LERLHEVSALVQERSGYVLDRWKPLTGEALFARESGAVASQFHDPPAIEPYAPEIVGAHRRVVLGKKSGLDSIRIKLADLELEADRERWPGLLVDVKRLGARKRGLVSDDEFRSMVAFRAD